MKSTNQLKLSNLSKRILNAKKLKSIVLSPTRKSRSAHSILSANTPAFSSSNMLTTPLSTLLMLKLHVRSNRKKLKKLARK